MSVQKDKNISIKDNDKISKCQHKEIEIKKNVSP